MSPILGKNNKSRDSSREKIEFNKNMNPFTPNEKRTRLKIMSTKGEFHRETIRHKRQDLASNLKLIKQKKLIDKFRKFEIRYNKTVRITKEAVVVKKSWTIIYVGIGMSFVINNAINVRRTVKKRSERHLWFLRMISKYIGRIRQKIKKIKVKNALAVKST